MIYDSYVNNSIVKNNSMVSDSYVDDSIVNNSKVYNLYVSDTEINNNAKIINGYITNQDSWYVCSNVGSENGTLTAYIDKNNEISVTRGCYHGTLDEFEERVEEVHKDKNPKVYEEYMLVIQLIKLKIKL